jgi:FKBP-type peptidyl-prolyl cis-trans isomerase
MRKYRALFTVAAVAGVVSFLIAADAPTSQPTKTVTASGLTIVETGNDGALSAATAKTGDQVWVDYTGKLTDGTKFDSSADHPDQPIVFVLGSHHVIPGWEEGIVGMKIGQKRQLIIPPNLAYGDNAQGPIPANSTLVFDVQLLGLKKGT